jgi:hypothetical protein
MWEVSMCAQLEIGGDDVQSVTCDVQSVTCDAALLVD